jgi:chorismate mutase
MGTIFNINQCFKPITYHILFDHALLPNRKMAVIEGKDDFEILYAKDMDIGNLQQAIRALKFLNSIEHEKKIEHLIYLKVNLQLHELINQQVELKA